GEAVTATRAWKSLRANELTTEILVWGTPTPLSCTRDHLVLVPDHGWMPAKDVRQGQFLVYPVRPIERSSSIKMGVFKKYDGVWGKQRLTARMPLEEFEPTFELGRLVGLYLAEGSIPKTKNGVPGSVIFAIHRDEVPTVEQWCRAVFGQELRNTHFRKTSKTALVGLNRRGFCYWLLENVGEKDAKRVPDCCWGLGREFCRGVVYGYLFGDGHYAKRDNGIFATSVRVAIPDVIRELIASLGHGWSQIAYREAGFYYNRNCRAAWILTI